MTFKTILLAGIAMTGAIASVPASATIYSFELTGGKTASFKIDTDTIPDFMSESFIGNQVSYNNVAGVFGGVAGTGAIGFGTFLVAQLNIGGTALGFTQYGGPDFFTFVSKKPVFQLGSFGLQSLTSGSATLTIGEVATAAVPEASTWAMMLAGFGGIGFAMRRRKTLVTTGVRFA